MGGDEGAEAHDRDGTRAFLLAIGAVIGASVAWGWLKPHREGEAEPASDVGGGIGELAGEPPHHGQTESTSLKVRTAPDGVPVAPVGALEPTPPPAWVRPTIVWTVVLVAGVVVAVTVLGLLHQVILYLLLALFFSFAMEPAVTYMHRQWHWKRGAATGLLLGLVFLGMLVLVLVFVPTLLKGAATIADRLPQAAQQFQIWAKDTLGIDVSTTSIESGGKEASSSMLASSASPLSTLVGFTASLVGGIFGVFTVGMFIFYMVAEAPQFRRAVLSFFQPARQQELLSI